MDHSLRAYIKPSGSGVFASVPVRIVAVFAIAVGLCILYLLLGLIFDFPGILYLLNFVLAVCP